MRLASLLSLARRGQLRPALAVGRLAEPLYRATWLATAGREGVLSGLADGPCTLEALTTRMGLTDSASEPLESWLAVGVSLGDLAQGADGYRLRSVLARRLAEAAHDPVLAILEETVDLHGRLLRETPARLREGRPFTLADQDGSLIARSSRIVEPFIHEAVARFVPPAGPVTLLEIGCGSGTHLRAAGAQNPALRALGVELQPEVAEGARANLAQWGLGDRMTVEVGDIRERPLAAEWDLATLHQNIYYFPVATRVALLRHVRGFLRPGGRLLVTTACRGGSAMVGVLDLWGAATEGAGRLPSADELEQQLAEAGFEGVTRQRLMPGEGLYAFVGEVPR